MALCSRTCSHELLCGGVVACTASAVSLNSWLHSVVRPATAIEQLLWVKGVKTC